MNHSSSPVEVRSPGNIRSNEQDTAVNYNPKTNSFTVTHVAHPAIGHISSSSSSSSSSPHHQATTSPSLNDLSSSSSPRSQPLLHPECREDLSSQRAAVAVYKKEELIVANYQDYLTTLASKETHEFMLLALAEEVYRYHTSAINSGCSFDDDDDQSTQEEKTSPLVMLGGKGGENSFPPLPPSSPASPSSPSSHRRCQLESAISESASSSSERSSSSSFNLPSPSSSVGAVWSDSDRAEDSFKENDSIIHMKDHEKRTTCSSCTTYGPKDEFSDETPSPRLSRGSALAAVRESRRIDGEKLLSKKKRGSQIQKLKNEVTDLIETIRFRFEKSRIDPGDHPDPYPNLLDDLSKKKYFLNLDDFERIHSQQRKTLAESGNNKEETAPASPTTLLLHRESPKKRGKNKKISSAFSSPEPKPLRR